MNRLILIKPALLFVFGCLLYASSTYSQVSLQWTGFYNGPSNGSDHLVDMVTDVSGNVYVTGNSSATLPNVTDFATIKYNSAGVQQWVARYNGPANGEDVATALTIDVSGNIYVTGWSTGIGTGTDIAIIKYSNSGIQQWVARYNGPAGTADYSNDIAIDKNGNVYVTGYAVNAAVFPDYVTLKFNSSGIQQWSKLYDGPANALDWAFGIAVDQTTLNVYVTGFSEGIGTDDDYTTIKYNTDGVQQWIQRYNGPANGEDNAKAIALDPAGNVYITGNSPSPGSFSDYTTIKYNSSGIQQWIMRFNGPANSYDQANAMAVDPFGNVYVTGFTDNASNLIDCATIQYNTEGVQQWVQLYNGPGNSADWANGIALDNAGNVYIAGMINATGVMPDFLTVKYNNSGVLLWVERYDAFGNLDNAAAIVVDVFNNVYVGGSVRTVSNDDYGTIKYIQPVSTIPAKIEAEDYNGMQGVQTELTSDIGGGLNLGYIDYGDWMDYRIQVPSTRTYELKLRLATPSISNPRFEVKNGETVLATVNVPNTGGFQIWQDLTILVTLPEGNQTIRLLSTGGGYWNINWLEFNLPVNHYTLIPRLIQAEDWNGMYGVQSENTSDAGGGVNLGFIDYGDWMDYNIQVPLPGSYELKFRLATPSISNPQFKVKNGETVLATVNVPNTGGFQIWQTHSIMVNLPAGNQTIRLLSTGGGYWNINWLEFVMPASFTRSGSSDEVREVIPEVRLFPNPVNETATLELNGTTEGKVQVDIIGMNGNMLKQYNFNKGVRNSRHTLSLSGLPAGSYMLRVQQNGKVETVKLLKL